MPELVAPLLSALILGLLGYVGLCSHSLEQALQNFARAFPYHQHDTLIRLVDMLTNEGVQIP